MKHRPDEQQQGPAAVEPTRSSHSVVRYTTLRLAIFVVALVLLWMVRVGGLLAVALALVISGLASYVLLSRQRDAMSVQLSAAAARRRDRAAARAAREDDVAEQLGRDAEHSRIR